MRFLLGAIFGLIVVAGAIFAASEVRLLLPNHNVEPTEVISEDAKETGKIAPTVTVDEPIDQSVEPSQSLSEITIDEQIDTVVRQGADMVVPDASVDQGHFLSTSTGEIVSDIEASADLLPENINLYVAETAQYRLGENDIADFPNSVAFVVWPDNPIITMGRPFYLLTPPLNIMDSFALKDIVNDQNGFYQNSFPESQGLFVRDLAVLAEASSFTKAIYTQMAQTNKSLIMYSGYVDPKMNNIIDETQVDFQRIDFVIDPNHERVSVEAQWKAIVEKARHGEELNILLDADSAGLDALKTAIGN